MHSYWPEGKEYMVGFVCGDGALRPLREFELERDAIAFVNYLNGGDGDRLSAWLAHRAGLDAT